jgi:hypothetical protein
MIDGHKLALGHAVDVDISADAVFDAFGFEFVAEAEEFFGGFHVGREWGKIRELGFKRGSQWLEFAKIRGYLRPFALKEMEREWARMERELTRMKLC